MGDRRLAPPRPPRVEPPQGTLGGAQQETQLPSSGFKPVSLPVIQRDAESVAAKKKKFGSLGHKHKVKPLSQSTTEPSSPSRNAKPGKTDKPFTNVHSQASKRSVKQAAKAGVQAAKQQQRKGTQANAPLKKASSYSEHRKAMRFPVRPTSPSRSMLSSEKPVSNNAFGSIGRTHKTNTSKFVGYDSDGREVVEEDIYQIGVVSSGKPMEQMATEVNRHVRLREVASRENRKSWDDLDLPKGTRLATLIREQGASPYGPSVSSSLASGEKRRSKDTSDLPAAAPAWKKKLFVNQQRRQRSPTAASVLESHRPPLDHSNGATLNLRMEAGLKMGRTTEASLTAPLKSTSSERNRSVSSPKSSKSSVSPAQSLSSTASSPRRGRDILPPSVPVQHSPSPVPSTSSPRSPPQPEVATRSRSATSPNVRHAIRVDSPPVFRPGSGWKPTETTISNHAGGGSRATVASRNPAACAEKYSSVRPPHKESARVAKARRGGGQSTVSQPPHLRCTVALHLPQRAPFTKELCLCAAASASELMPVIVSAALGSGAGAKYDIRELGLQLVPKRSLMKGDMSDGKWMIGLRSLVSYMEGNADKIALVLSRLPKESMSLIKVRVPGKQNTTVTIKANDGTTVVDVILKVLKKLRVAGALGVLSRPPHQYGLYFQRSVGCDRGVIAYEGPALDESSCLRPLLEDRTELVFAPLSNTQSLTEALPLRVLGDDGKELAQCLFAPEGSVLEARAQAQKSCSLDLEFRQTGLYLPPVQADNRSDGFFMDDSKLLKEYHLRANEVVELRRRFHAIPVLVTPKSSIVYKCDDTAIAADALEMLSFNFPQYFPTGSKVMLYVDGGPMVDPARVLWSVPLGPRGLVLREAPQPLVIFFDGASESFEVDPSHPLGAIMKRVFARFGLKALNESQYKLIQLGAAGRPIDPTRSLRTQKVDFNATVILKVPDKATLEASRLSSIPAQEKDVCIWDEAANSSTIVYAKDVPPGADASLPPIHAATFNKLVERLTASTGLDSQFGHAFLLTYRSFATPEQLFRKLQQRYKVPPGTPNASAVQMRVCTVIKNWIEGYYNDFSQGLAQDVVDFVDETLMPAGPTTWQAKLGRQLRNSILRRACEMRVLTEVRRRTRLFSGCDDIATAVIGDTAVLDQFFEYSDDDIAEQMTCIDSTIFSLIRPHEFLNQSWAKKDSQHRCPHVMKSIDRFNRMSLWVAAQIVEPMRIRDRVKVWTRLIRIAQALRRRNNFSTLMAFTSGFNHAAIQRLKHSRAMLQRGVAKILEDIERLGDPEGSYKAYRSALKAAPLPALPYLGVYLKDLTFIEDGERTTSLMQLFVCSKQTHLWFGDCAHRLWWTGNPDFVHDGLINFTKRGMLYKVISETQNFQAVPYPYKLNHDISMYLMELMPYEEEDVYKASLEREPRGCDRAQLA